MINLHRKTGFAARTTQSGPVLRLPKADYLAHWHCPWSTPCGLSPATLLENLSTALLPWLQHIKPTTKETEQCALRLWQGDAYYILWVLCHYCIITYNDNLIAVFCICAATDTLSSFSTPQLFTRWNGAWKISTLHAKDKTSSTLCSGLSVSATAWPSQKWTYVCVSQAFSFWMLSGTEQ